MPSSSNSRAVFRVRPKPPATFSPLPMTISSLYCLRKQYKLEMVIGNGENVAGGFGLTLNTARELLDDGIDVLTSGNHVFAQKEIIPYLDTDMPVLRPLNYPAGVPGRGYQVFGRIVVVNLIGRTFMNNYDRPFRTMDRLLEDLANRPPVLIIAFHDEA